MRTGFPGRRSRLFVAALIVASMLLDLTDLSQVRDLRPVLAISLIVAGIDIAYASFANRGFLSLSSIVVLGAVFHYGHPIGSLARIFSLVLVFPYLWWSRRGNPLLFLLHVPPVVLAEHFFLAIGGPRRMIHLPGWLAAATLTALLFGAVTTLLYTLVYRDPGNGESEQATELLVARLLRGKPLSYFTIAFLGLVLAVLWHWHLYLALLGGSLLVSLSALTFSSLERLQEMKHGILSLLMSIVESKDPYTRGHSERVAAYSVTLAALVGVPPWQLEELYRAALLHDLGKIAVPEYVILKAGRLTGDEFSLVKRHPVAGAELVARFDHSPRVVAAVRHHHERYDGRGYPAGLAGLRIPLWARIIAVADAFDAMTSHRPYRTALRWQEAVEELWRGTGVQFDPAIARRAALFFAAHRPEEPETGVAEPPPPQLSLEDLLRKSSVARQISPTASIYSFREGVLRHLSGNIRGQHLQGELVRLGQAGVGAPEALRTYVISPDNQVYHVRLFPLDSTEALLVATDITPLVLGEPDASAYLPTADNRDTG